jgi:uncharacterized protein YkwD
MARKSKARQSLVLETLESRQVLSGAAPSAELQYALELVNLTRTNPSAGAEVLTSSLARSTRDSLEFYGVDLSQAKREVAGMQARQPLAWNDRLAAAAEQHSRDMAEKGFQSHTGSDGSTANDRMARNGYTGASRAAENAFAYGESVDHAIQAFVIDWGVSDKGHRRNLLEPENGGDDSFKEIGIGLVSSKKAGMGKVMTQNLGVRPNTKAQLLGVAYDDMDRDHFYDIGEGRGGVTVEITAQDGKTVKVETAEPGGYQVELAAGTYKVRATQGDREVSGREVRIGTKNVKLDFLMNEATVAPRPTAQETSGAKGVATTKPTVANPKPAKTVTLKTTGGTANTAPVTTMVVSRAAGAAQAPVITNAVSNSAPSKPAPEPASAMPSLPRDGYSWNMWSTVPKGQL